MGDAPSDKIPDAQAVEVALEALLQSDRFRRSERLSAFLTYIVEETLSGRSGSIRAKTIAQDVYRRDPTSNDYSENVVRVDARRLRRLLEEHYADEGSDVELHISLPTGGYRPQFERPSAPTDPTGEFVHANKPQNRNLKIIASAGIALAAGLAMVVYAVQGPGTARSPATTTTEAERLALINRSGASLQAENLCRQGRNLLFPIADMSQQKTATDLFYRAVELDPNYPCGYAGAAHSLGTQALLTADNSAKGLLLTEAEEMADKAQSIAPTDGWAVSGRAWVTVVAGETERAFELSKLSAQLSPTNGNVLDFHGVISIFAGDYEEARRATDPARLRDTKGLQHAQRNVYGVASYHGGAYSEAVAAFENAIRLGEPVSALTLMFLAVSHQANGNSQEAKAYVKDLEASFPNFPVRAVLEGFYPDPQASNKIIGHLREAGWKD